MKYGTTATGKIHVFTDMNECLCDLNIKIDKEVSKEYAETRPCTKICGSCQSCLSSDSPHKHKSYRA
jgi:hypothetical protein